MAEKTCPCSVPDKRRKPCCVEAANPRTRRTTLRREKIINIKQHDHCINAGERIILF